MAPSLTAATLALVVVVSLLLAVLLAWALLRARSSRGKDSSVYHASTDAALTHRDEITQPLPFASKPYVNTNSAVRLLAAQRTDKGRVRSHNEDDTLIMDLQDEAGEVRTALYAVADGVGGAKKGEVASRTAIESVIQALRSDPFFKQGEHLKGEYDEQTVVEVLRNAVMSANRDVYSVRVEQNVEMGTTIVLALVMGSKAYVANVGDSRAYLLSDGGIRQITQDHSLVERMVTSGQITRAEARLHPRRNLILRSLGTDPHVEVDLFVEPLQPGDRLLLCSDGLSGPVPDEALAHLSSRESNVDRACRAMIDAANQAGGSDNISVVLAEIVAS